MMVDRSITVKNSRDCGHVSEEGAFSLELTGRSGPLGTHTGFMLWLLLISFGLGLVVLVVLLVVALIDNRVNYNKATEPLTGDGGTGAEAPSPQDPLSAGGGGGTS